MHIPEELKYTKSHEWIRVEGNTAFVGITDYAQESLGDIVYIELPELEQDVTIDDELTTIESVKAAEPIFAPLTGRIIEVNEDLQDSPEQINEDPYGTHIFAMEIDDPTQLDSLLDSDGYERVVQEESE